MRKMILSLGMALLGTTMMATNGSAFENKKASMKARVENENNNDNNNSNDNSYNNDNNDNNNNNIRKKYRN